MILTAWILIALPIVLIAYAYVGYPVLLMVLARGRRARARATYVSDEWPLVSVSLPAYNEESQIRGAIESLLRLDYPTDRLQILVVSDASTDATDDIVREYADRGVELLRMPERGGKTVGENAAAALLKGEIVVNTDASIRLRADAVRELAARFADPTVGVASGRDVSIAKANDDPNVGEAGYVGYEMAIRALETRIRGIIGASGCCYAIRSHLHRVPLPPKLSRDFASALIAREHGYRAVSVDEAVCFVPRTDSLRREFRRKVRTIARGIETLFFKRHLLNPVRYGSFAWMLWSHKVARWAVPWTMVSGVIGLGVLATTEPWAGILLAICAAGVLLGVVGWLWPESRRTPRLLAIPAFALVGNLGALYGLCRAIAGRDAPVWEPTRRPAMPNGAHEAHAAREASTSRELPVT